MSGAHEQTVEKIVDFHIQRGAERGAQSNYADERKHGDMFHLNHNYRCVCYSPRRPLYSSLWPLKGFQQPSRLAIGPGRNDNRLFALTGRFNYTESEWKSIDILEYDFAGKAWGELATMPKECVKAHFQQHSWDYMRVHSHGDDVFVMRTDGVSQGAIYNMAAKTWDLDWRFPVFPDGSAWFHDIAPFNVILNATPWERYLSRCFTHGVEPSSH